MILRVRQPFTYNGKYYNIGDLVSESDAVGVWAEYQSFVVQASSAGADTTPHP